MAVATVAVEGQGKILTSDNADTWTTVTGSPSTLATQVTSTFVEGTSGMSYKVSNTTAATACQTAANLAGEPYNFSSGGGHEGQMIYVWLYPFFNYDTLALGGIRVYVVDDLATDAKAGWYVGPQPGYKGGWYNYCVDPSMPFDNIVAAGTNTWTTNGNPAQLSGIDGVGHGFKITATFGAAVNNCYADCISILKGYYVTGGDGADADASFDSFITYESSNNIGATRSIGGGLFTRCKVIIGGTGAENTAFTDDGFNVVWEPVYRSDGTTAGVPADFYEFSLRKGTGTTDVTLANGSFACSSPHEVYVDLVGSTSCTMTNVNFTRARLLDLDGAVNWNGGTVTTSGLMTLSGQATLNNITFVDPTDSTALKVTNNTHLANVSNLKFTRGAATNHAIEITATGTYDFDGITFSGYAGTDGSTGNEAFYNNSGGLVTINVNSGDSPTIRNAASSTTTLVVGSRTISLNVKDATGTNVQNARVLLYATSGGFPANVTVTIANSSTTATVTHTSHGLATNDKILIRGASHAANNGVFVITVTDTNTYTYTMGSAPGSSPTGTIKASFVFLGGSGALTDANGNISMSRTIGSSTEVTGWARKSSGTPYYKTGLINGTVSSTANSSFSAVLIADQG